MRSSFIAGAAACLIVGSAGQARSADYPLTLSAMAEATLGSTTVNSVITISVDRLMLDSRHTRAVDALKYGGYAKFLNTIRPLPVIGKIATDRNAVEVRYAWESQVEGKRRLIIVADKPLFFLGGGSDKQKAGYELTVVELLFDQQGHATGTIAGAARVKPSSEQGVILGDYAESPVRLTVRAGTSR